MGCFSEHGSMAQYQPYLCSKTKVFRMSDVKYDENGSLVEWMRDSTWGGSFIDKGVDCPLVLTRKPYPKYLTKYLESSQCKEDPMSPE